MTQTPSGGDFWAAQLPAIAKATGADALAIVVRTRADGYVTLSSHNLAADPRWNEGEVAQLLKRSAEQRTCEQPRDVVLPLSDGRTASSLVIAPLAWGDGRVDALVAMRAGAPYANGDLARLEGIGQIVGAQLAEARAAWRARRDKEELARRAKLTRDLQNAVGGQGDPDRLLQAAAEHLATAFRADGVSIMLADERGDLAIRASVGLKDEVQRERPVNQGIAAYVARTGEELLLVGTVKGEQYTGSDPSIAEALVVPLRSAGRTLGAVSVKHYAEPGRYDRDQLESLASAAADIANALATAETIKRADEDRMQAIVLYQLARFALGEGDREADLQAAVALVADTLGHDAVGLWVLDPDGSVHLRAARGYESSAQREIASPNNDRTLAAVLRGHTERLRASEAHRPEWMPVGLTDSIAAPVGARGHVQGALVLGRRQGEYTQPQIDFAGTIAEYLAAMMRATATSDVGARAAAAERRRIAQELHDGLAQEITAVVLALEGCQRALERNPAALAPQLAKTARDARATLSDVRQYMASLRQTGSDAQHLPVTINRLVDDARRQSGLVIDLEYSGIERPLPAAVERAVARVVGEALRNATQHASARTVKITLQYGDRHLDVGVRDDGIGFDAEYVLATAEERGHFGLVGMRERIESVGGQFRIDSGPGSGTALIASVPYSTAVSAAVTPQPAGTTKSARAAAAPAPDAAEQPATKGILGRIFGR